MRTSNISVLRFIALALFVAALAFPVFSFAPHAHAQLTGGNSGTGTGLGGGNGGTGTGLGGGNGGTGTGLGGGNSGCGGTTGGLTNPLGSTCDLAALLGAILTFITTSIGPVIVTLMLVYCGFLFVTARGNEESIRTARTALLWTVIGALILLGATALKDVIVSTIGTL